MQDPFDELNPGAKGDCGCGGRTASSAAGALPPPAELESVLEQYVSSASAPDAGLDLALADELLFADADLALPDVGDAQQLGLQDLIALAEQNPGLKISLSFG